MKMEYYGWEDIDGMCEELARKIIKSRFRPDMIVGIGRGGWVPARLLSDILGIQSLTSMKIEFYTSIARRKKKPVITQPIPVDVKDKNLLLVDDVSDTGESLILAMKNLMMRGAKRVKVATLHFKRHSKFKPDYFIRTTDAWIVYPWERKETERLRR